MPLQLHAASAQRRAEAESMGHGIATGARASASGTVLAQRPSQSRAKPPNKAEKKLGARSGEPCRFVVHKLTSHRPLLDEEETIQYQRKVKFAMHRNVQVEVAR